MVCLVLCQCLSFIQMFFAFFSIGEKLDCASHYHVFGFVFYNLVD